MRSPLLRDSFNLKTQVKPAFAAVLAVALFSLIALMPMTGEAVQKVSPRYGFIEFHGGPTFPIGEYESIGGIPFRDQNNRTVEISADQAYDPGFVLGASYGQVLRGHLQASVGFRFTKAKIDDALVFNLERPSINVYDLQFNANWLMLDLSRSGWTPYVGVGAHAGFVEVSYDNFENEYEAGFDAGLNFGVEVKVWKGSSRDFITLASINNVSILAANERPKNLNLGFGVRYYFK